MDDDQKMNDLLAQAYNSAPLYVQDFLDEDKFSDFMLDLQAEMKMHADTATNVSNQILLTLLGVIEPGELPAELKNAGLEEAVIPEVIKKVNDSIFAPLQEEARKGALAPAASAPRAQASSAPATPIVSVPAPVAPLPAPAPLPTPLPTPAPEPILPPPPVPVVAAEEPTMRTMAHDVEAMQTGHTPAPTPYAMPSPPPTTTQSVPPPAEPIAPSINQFARPAAPLIAPTPPVVPPSQMPVAPSIAKTPVPDIHEVTSTLQKYGIDPYREPPE